MKNAKNEQMHVYVTIRANGEQRTKTTTARWLSVNDVVRLVAAANEARELEFQSRIKNGEAVPDV